jgi:hypothetical protein
MEKGGGDEPVFIHGRGVGLTDGTRPNAIPDTVGGERGPGAAKPDGVQSSSQETFLPRNNLGYLAPDRSVHLGGPEARHSTDTNHHFGTVESSATCCSD